MKFLYRYTSYTFWEIVTKRESYIEKVSDDKRIPVTNQQWG